MLSESLLLYCRLMGRPVSEYGRLCHGGGGHGRSDRRRRAFMLAAEVVPKLCPTPAHSGAFQHTPAHAAVWNLSCHSKQLRTLTRTGE